MRKILPAIFILTLLLGCEKKNCCTNISAIALIRYVNADGDDLLDPIRPDAILANDIDIYLQKKGVKEKVYNPNLDAPENFKIYKSTKDGYILRLFFPIDSDAAEKDKITIYIRHKNNHEDKLVGEFNAVKGSSIILQKIWINDADRGAPSHLESKAFTIVK